MKKFISSLLILTATFGLTGCEDFLQVNPKQVLDENLLVKPSDMEGFVTAAYARMTDIPSWDHHSHLGGLVLFVLMTLIKEEEASGTAAMDGDIWKPL